MKIWIGISLGVAFSGCTPDDNNALPQKYVIDENKDFNTEYCLLLKREAEIVMTARQRGMDIVDAEAALKKHFTLTEAEKKERVDANLGDDTATWEIIETRMRASFNVPRGSNRSEENQAISDAGSSAYLKCMEENL
ncbi:MAG: hypothetical protein EOP84_03160 [Verrucomicrobiaceae bacterium]|nr:MAG: hypothetical protein EOP84_03160 [Verrucomicrobiaceae bacterium]